MKEIELKIEKMAYGGLGMGRINGKIVFVPYVLPGEIVKVEIVHEKKDYAHAILREIKEAAPLRKNPFCPHFSKCGGCHYQHFPYGEQLRLKEEMLKEFLRPLFNQKNFQEIKSIVASPENVGYRLRAQLKGARKSGKQALGFYEMKSHRLVEIEECPLLHPLANFLLRGLREWLKKEPEFFIRNLEIMVSPEEDKGIICIQANGYELEKRIWGLIIYVPKIKGIIVTGEKSFQVGDLTLSYQVSGAKDRGVINLQASCASFTQVNMEINRQMIRLILDWAALKGEEEVIDLFCGIGNLSLPLAQVARRVWGVDVNEEAIALARQNAHENKLTNCTFLEAAAEEGLRAIKKELEKVDVAVLDPPRAGAGKRVLECLVKFQPEKIIYVSCQLPTLVRDLKMLGSWGYGLQKIQALDMFPHTYHAEIVAILVRSHLFYRGV